MKWDAILYIVIGIVAVVALLYFARQYAECSAARGVMLRDIFNIPRCISGVK